MLRRFIKNSISFQHFRCVSSSATITQQPPAVQEVSDLTNVAVEGYVIKGLNVFVGESDPVIKADSEYPQWMWQELNEPKSKDLAAQPLLSPEEDPLLYKRQQKAIRKEKNKEKRELLKKKRK